jgi:AraC-like DNA-binding protein
VIRIRPRAREDVEELSGSLASRRRTVAGVLGQLDLAEVPTETVASLLRLAGLPHRALEDQDFPVTLDQELRILAHLVERLRARRESLAGWALATFSNAGINLYGILGLTMQHAATGLDALAVLLSWPELCWGHSRVHVRRDTEALVLDFGMDAPEGAVDDALAEYCVTTDVASVVRLLADVLGPDHPPRRIELPFADPAPAVDVARHVPCLVRFGADAARVIYRPEVADAVPVHASELAFRRYEKVARSFSRLLADEESTAEQVTRLLWAYRPAPSREQLADMLELAPRTLARRLRAEGTSFAELLQTVQLERATGELRETSAPVAEIAERLGYSDPAAFTRAFRAWTGEAPSRWRARHRGTPRRDA